MKRFSYIELWEATSKELLREQITSVFSRQGYIVITDVPSLGESRTILFNQLQKRRGGQYTPNKMIYSCLGESQCNGVLTRFKNYFPLQNELLIKLALGLRDEEFPEILKRSNEEDFDILTTTGEKQINQLTRQVFAKLMSIIEQTLKPCHNLEQIVKKSEVQKSRDIVISPTQDDCTNDEKEQNKFESPDFGLGSVLLKICHLSKEKQSLENEIDMFGKDGYFFKSYSTGEQNIMKEVMIKIDLGENDVILTCGNILHEIMCGQIILPKYYMHLSRIKGYECMNHQEFIFPYLGWQALKSSYCKGILPCELNIISEKERIKKGWLRNYLNEIISYIAKEYALQVLNEYSDVNIDQRILLTSKHSSLHCFHFSQIDSTMNIAKFWKTQYVTESMSFAFSAKQQGKGRGQNNNTWLSPKGNCYVTFLVKFDSSLSFCAPQLAAVSIVEVLDDYFKISGGLSSIQTQNVHMKWINDVFVNEKKIAGVLCTSEGDYVSIGIGVNINVIPNLDSATSLAKELNLSEDISIDQFIDKLWQKLSENIALVKQKNSPEPVFLKMNGRLQFLHQKVTIYDSTLQKVLHQGIFRGINEYGNALLENINDRFDIITIYDGRMRSFG